MIKDPVNVKRLNLASVRAASDDKVAWKGAFPTYGGEGAEKSVTVFFTIAPGQKLGGHTDSAEEVQFILGGQGELILNDGRRPMTAGDIAVLPEGVWHDLWNTGTETLQVVGFFAAPAVNQKFDDVMLPGNSHYTGSPNAPEH